jgi:hypothetical protein
MSTVNGTLQVVVSVAAAKGSRSGQRRNVAGPKLPDQPRVPRIARLMALAVKFQGMVDRGEVRDYADLARLGFVTRARLTQIMNLLLLAPDIQERLLCGVLRQSITSERHLRPVIRSLDWATQRALFTKLIELA